MRSVRSDARLASVPGDRWARAEAIRERGWLRDVRVDGPAASCSCSMTGLVGLAVKADRRTLQTSCPCADAPPCEHGLALLLEAGPDADVLVESDPADPGRVLLHGALPPEADEALRWLWWRREADDLRSGEARTLAQALQLLHERSLLPPAAPRALYRQRALGEPVAVRLLDAGSDRALALAKLLADRGARPFPGQLPAELWTLESEVSFAAWLLLALERGEDVRPDPTLDPRPLAGTEVEMDVGCLPARLKAPASPALDAFLARVDPRRDEERGHVLIPAARVAAVEDGLRALGADIHYRRLAPPRERFLEWPAHLPEDMSGARPRLREPFHGSWDAPIPGLKPDVELAGYQKEAVAFIAHHQHTCLLADDMGLGKTLESLAAAQLVEGRVLVVCPASAREVWRREVGKFTTESVVVLGPGEDPSKADGPEKYVVTGYSNLEALQEGIHPERFAMVVLDESHYVKNAGTGRARLVHDLLQQVPRRLVISGTPVMNTPDEMRAQLAFLHPDEWSDGAWFKKRFEEPFEGGSDEVREQVLARLRQFLEGVMIRREKREALPDLPEKRIAWHRAPLPAESRRAYVALEQEFVDAFASGAASAGGKLERLKQAAVAGKLPALISFVRGLVSGGDKVVVFSRYRDALSSLADEFRDAGAVTLTGDSSPEERAEAERRFQDDPACRVFLGQLVAAGTALTLVAGTHAVFLDLSWNPADHRQAMDRIHRRGQTRPVTAHFFLAEGTVDEDVAAVLDAKGRMMDALLAPTGGAAGPRGARRAVGERLLARTASAARPSA